MDPYILFVMDVSGSMDNDTNFGNPSCYTTDTNFTHPTGGGPDVDLASNRLNHAKCALSNIVNGYGDMVMGLGRFRQGVDAVTGSLLPYECDMRTRSCGNCDSNAADCEPRMSSGDRFEVLVPIVEGNQNDLLKWVDFSSNTCYPDNSQDPELIYSGATPIGGSLKGAKRYWQGALTPGIDTSVGTIPYWTGPGDDPIRDDPLKNVIDVNTGYQCRPYIVIMMTDGDETCVFDFQDTVDAAASLLTTDVDGSNYRIEVKPIGLGKAPGDTEIEQLAHAGGATDVAGQYEGYYAQNESELSLAISQIISSAIKFETCNDIDDDCDLLVDEDFPAKGLECHDGALGICRGTGALVCTAGGGGVECDITNPGQTATTETCNSLDDDCDGNIDEGGVCTGCTTEICDGFDNDCDMAVDEDLTRSCGTDVGVCVAGTETCNAGTWEGCDAVDGGAESCDTLDNDCDGVADGLVEQCAVIPTNNPGVGICTYGTRVCPADSGVFGPCLGEQGPVAEICDLLDNDCDGNVDEDTGGATCQTACGMGLTECVNGTIECGDTVMTGMEICDGDDNDCDGKTDENVPDMGPCSMYEDGTPLCEDGTSICLNGTYQCVGGVPSSDDLCDCSDNDCDGTVDEQGDALCPGNSTCESCQCAYECAAGEFPCPSGQYCADLGGGKRVCLYDACYNVDCPPSGNGDVYECVDGECVRSCDLVTCSGGLVCLGSTGQCVPDTCESFPERCDDTQTCHSGECVPNPCAGVTCPGAQYCADGQCYDSCSDVMCGAGERCVLGECEADPCGGDCGRGRFCDEDSGECLADRCTGVDCQAGQDCDPSSGSCRTDPCLGVVCPGEGEVCDEGTCRPMRLPDAGPSHEFVTAVGGGCCSAGDDGGPGGGTLLLALFVLIGITRRSRISETDHA